jgi:uroporphyrinogen-III synthase
LADLERRVIAFLEGRRATELADLIDRHNGVPLAAPCLREVHRPDAPSLQSELRTVCASEVAVFIFLTGVGTATVFEAARHAASENTLRERLNDATVVVRGPKPTAVLRKLGVRIDLTAPPPNTTRELLELLEPLELQNSTVAVQLYGAPNPDFSQVLKARGATVLEMSPYVWERPVDPKPILNLLDELDGGAVDALLVTSQQQVENLFDVARQHGRTPRLKDVALGPQGPVAESALERHGLHASFRPAHGHMGALVLAAADYLSSREGVLN